jgi:hypothetical protein
MELKTIAIIFCFLIILGIGIYFIHKNTSSGPVPVPVINPCPQCGPSGCDSNGNCNQPPCDGIKVRVNGSCVCPDGTQGINCGCTESNKPGGLTDSCNGVGYVCQSNSDGTDSWVHKSAQSCSDLYSMNGGTAKSYNDKCLDTICTAANGYNPDDYTYILSCQCQEGENCKPICQQQGCSKVPGPNDCKGCYSTDGKPNTVPGVCNCIDNKWTCDTTPLTNNCTATVPTGLCGSGGEKADCINCHNGNFMWHCSGSPLTEECAKGIFNVQTSDYNNSYDIYEIPGTSSENPMPIYPVIDNNRCLQGVTPYTKLQDYDTESWNLFPNPEGIVTYDTTGKIIGFTPIPIVDNNYIIYKKIFLYIVFLNYSFTKINKNPVFLLTFRILPSGKYFSISAFNSSILLFPLLKYCRPNSFLISFV